PRDAVEYKHYTTIEGIIEKDNPEIYDYDVPEKLKKLYREKDYGPYAAEDGTVHVCFTASNHTTGGNSGSPVVNSEGHMIGINFDRNWEGTMSDIMYDPSQCRNITLDIRYALFIIDKFAGAGYLVEEMDLVW
ncbi:MAG: S46 family peptidase, partial [Bacteroidota bacterium]